MPLSYPDIDLAAATAARGVLRLWPRGELLDARDLALRHGLPAAQAHTLLLSLADAGMARADASGFRRNARGVRLFVADLGGTKLNAAIVDEEGAVLAESSEPTVPGGAAAVVDQIVGFCIRLRTELALPAGEIGAGAVGVPGSPHPSTGRVALAPNIPGLDGLDVVTALADGLGFPVRIENDVNMAALGEFVAGAASGAGSAAFVALGTGIGMGLIVDGRLVRGATGMAGEIALLPLGADSADAASYRHGPFETAIGSGGMLATARRLGAGEIASGEALFAAARAGSAAANAALDETVRTLFTGLLAVRAIVDPEIVVLGGSIGLQPEIGGRLAMLAAGHPYAPRIVTSTLGPAAMLAGAAHAALAELLRACRPEAAERGEAAGGREAAR